MRLPIISVLLLGAAACQAEGPRFTSDEDACSFAELPGWQTDRAKGSLLLRDGSGATIAIRSVPAANDWVEPRTPALMTPAVRKVLEVLPDARVAGPTPVRAGMDGVSFDVSFTPSGKHERYLRRHVVLYGDEGHVFHVVLTAPEASAEAGTKAFEKIIDSFREEV